MSTIMRVDHLPSVSNIHAKAGCAAGEALLDAIKPVIR